MSRLYLTLELNYGNCITTIQLYTSIERKNTRQVDSMVTSSCYKYAYIILPHTNMHMKLKGLD